jgi:hypothetical protein
MHILARDNRAPDWRLAAWLVAGAALAAAAALLAVRLVTALGRNIPQPDVATDYAVGCLWALAIGAGIAVWPLRSRERTLLLVGWAMRCFVTLGFMLTYEWNYDVLDAYSYFAHGSDPSLGLKLGNGTENITALVWLHARLGIESYHAIKVTFSFVGFLAVYILYRGITRVLGRESAVAFLVLSAWPSVLFWSSILGKDPVVLFGMAVYCYGVLDWFRSRGGRSLGIAALGVVLAMTIRLWLGPILLAPLAYLLARGIRGAVARTTMFAVGAVALAGALVLLRDRLLLETASDLFATVDTVSRGWAEGGSGQQIVGDLTNPVSLLLFLPRGMFTALFRPLPGEVNNLFGALAGLESLLLLGLLGVAIARTKLRELAHPLVQWSAMLIIGWSAVYSVLSYQNLGTAVRFRLQILPVLLGFLTIMARRRRAGDTLLDAPATRALPPSR